MSSTPDQILKRARSHGRGSVFTPADFLDVGSRDAVDQALSRLSRDGRLRRIARGLYDFPQVHPKLGLLAPTPDKIAKALARESGSALQIAGAYAANVLGLSTQVPARATYLTDGPSRRVVIGKRVVDMRHASPKHLVAPGTAVGTVVQALRHLGPDAAPSVIKAASRHLSASDRMLLSRSARQAPAWMQPTLGQIAHSIPAG